MNRLGITLLGLTAATGAGCFEEAPLVSATPVPVILGEAGAGLMTEDSCPELTSTPADLPAGAPHCCQRADNSAAALPAFKLTGMVMDSPAVFAQAAVSSANAASISDDRYNWVMQLSQPVTGVTGETDVVLHSGAGLHNTDGTFRIANGPVVSGGKMFNQDGAWDQHDIPAKLSPNADGSWHLETEQYMGERLLQVPSWTDTDLNFVGMALAMTGVQMSIDIDADLSCAGHFDATGNFDLVGILRGYLPVEALKTSCLYFSATDKPCNEAGFEMCEFTSGALDCKVPQNEWTTGNDRAVNFPDSLCDAEKCVPNIDVAGTCSPGADGSLPACNAWVIDGNYALQAVAVSEGAPQGRPM